MSPRLSFGNVNKINGKNQLHGFVKLKHYHYPARNTFQIWFVCLWCLLITQYRIFINNAFRSSAVIMQSRFCCAKKPNRQFPRTGPHKFWSLVAGRVPNSWSMSSGWKGRGKDAVRAANTSGSGPEAGWIFSIIADLVGIFTSPSFRQNQW